MAIDGMHWGIGEEYVVVVLLGPSCSGKTSVANAMQEYGFKRIITYTTRPKRVGEINGYDYYFISEEEFFKKKDMGFFAETCEYDASWGKCFYGSALEDYENLRCDKVVVLTPEGVNQLDEDIPTYEVCLYPPQEEIMRRMLNRGDDPVEVARRVKTDSIIFDEYIYSNSFPNRGPHAVAKEIKRPFDMAKDIFEQIRLAKKKYQAYSESDKGIIDKINEIFGRRRKCE